MFHWNLKWYIEVWNIRPEQVYKTIFVYKFSCSYFEMSNSFPLHFNGVERNVLDFYISILVYTSFIISSMISYT